MASALKSNIALSVLGGLLFLAGILALLFSSAGNLFVAKLLTQYLQSQTNLAWEARKFRLTPNSFSLDFAIQNGELELFVDGNYSLLAQNLSGDFLLNSNGFMLPLKSDLKPLNIAENIWIEGKFAGEFANYFIQASSNILQANSDFNANFSYLALQNIILIAKEASLQKVFEMFNMIPYADGILNFDLQLNRYLSQAGNNFDGKISLSIDGGNLETEAFLKVFNLNIPSMRFIAQLEGAMAKNTLEHTFNLYSNIGDILLSGTTNLQTFDTDTDFNIKIQSLSSLSSLFKIPLNGSFLAKGIAQGDVKNMHLEGGITLENSPLDFHLSLQNLKPYSFELSSQNLEAMAFLKLLNQPAYLNGTLILKVLLSDFTHGTSGVGYIQGKHLLLNNPLLQSHTQINLPPTAFDLDSKIELTQGKGLLEYALDSNIISLRSQGGNITLKPFLLKLPQTLNIYQLQNLSYHNNAFVNGALFLEGILTQDSLELNGTITQEKQESKASLTLNHNSLNLSLDNLSIEQIHTIFPKIPPILANAFNGRTNMLLQHDFIEQTKQINLDFIALKFQDSTFLKAIHQASCQNLSNTAFNGYFYSQFHEDDTLQSKFSLHNLTKSNKNSSFLQIQAPEMITNLNTQMLDGNLIFQCEKITQNASLEGSIQSPKFIKRK